MSQALAIALLVGLGACLMAACYFFVAWYCDRGLPDRNRERPIIDDDEWRDFI